VIVDEGHDGYAPGQQLDRVGVVRELAIVLTADPIFVIKDGAVVEAGTHAELMGHRGGGTG
jgi:ABC-type transport system involved in Fe-S cluster assembly fused permease/ATPase subunit